MIEKQLLLSWDEFEKTTQNSFRDLLGDVDFADVTLATEDGHQINSHKLILRSCSPFFDNILRKNPHQNPLIYLKDIHYAELQKLLVFMYVGQCEIAQNSLDTFLATAKALHVKGLDDLAASVEVKEKASLATKEIICQKNSDPSLGDYLKCKLCGLEFYKQLDLQKHSDNIHKDYNEEYHQENMNHKMLSTKNVAFNPRVSKEMSQNMLNLKSLGKKCLLCDKEFKFFKTLLLPHYAYHLFKDIEKDHANNFTLDSCNICGKYVSTRKSKVIHLGVKHEAILPFLSHLIRPEKDLIVHDATGNTTMEDELSQEEIDKQWNHFNLSRTCKLCKNASRAASRKRALKHAITKHFSSNMQALESTYFDQSFCLKCEKNFRARHEHIGLWHGELFPLMRS